jgi:adenylyltransferase/sulfurtransferase
MDISADEISRRLERSELLNIIDVREPVEYHTRNIGGINIPLGSLADRIDELDMDSGQELIVICQHGIRSRTAQTILAAQGFTNVRNLKGGLVKLNSILHRDT